MADNSAWSTTKANNVTIDGQPVNDGLEDSPATTHALQALMASLGAGSDATFNTVTGTTSGHFGTVYIWDGLASNAPDIFIGTTATGGATTSSSGHNIGIGNSVLTLLTSGTHSTVVGSAAMLSGTGSQNSVFGALAGTGLTTGANNTLLGYDAEPSSGAVSNEITLGNGSVTALRIPGLSATSVNATKWGYVAGADQAVKTSDSPQFAGVNLGHATDTTLARSSAGNITVEGNLIYRAGGTDVPVADGGTGASTAANARTNLGAQASDAGLTSIAGLTTAADRMIYTTAHDTYAVATLTSAARSILDDASVGAIRTTLGVGTADTPTFAAINLGDTNLSDYAESTWTPVVADAASGGNTATGTFTGVYTRIGREVRGYCSLVNIDTTGMTSGNDLFIRGLPFTVGTIAYCGGSPILRFVTFAGTPVVQLETGTTYFRVAEVTSAANTDFITVGEVSSGTGDIFASFSYYI